MIYVRLAVLAAMLGLGWGLYSQIRANGVISAQLVSEQVGAALNAEKAKATITALKTDRELRDAISTSLQTARNRTDANSARQAAAINTVYREPAVAPWATTVPPDRIRAAAAAALDCLWQHGPEGAAGAGDCARVTAGGADAGLPASGGGHE